MFFSASCFKFDSKKMDCCAIFNVFRILGQYMFIETSSPRVPGDKAYLLSEPFDPTSSSGRCLQFWHHMNGASIGTLNVYIYTGNFSTMSLLWQRIGNKGDNWLLGQTPIRSSVKYQVRCQSACILNLGIFQICHLPQSFPLSFRYKIVPRGLCYKVTGEQFSRLN